MVETYYIKFRVAGKKRSWFYADSREEGSSKLKIHATRFPADKVDAAMASLQNINPDWEFFKAPIS